MKNVGRTGRPSAQMVAVEQQNTRIDTISRTANGAAWTLDSGPECSGDRCADCPSCPAAEALEITGLAFFLTDDLLADPEASYLGVRIRDLALLPGQTAIQAVKDRGLDGLATFCTK